MSAVCGLSGRNRCVGQGASRRSVACRGEIAAWVKEIVGGMWSVGVKTLSGSRGQSLACGLSGQNRCVGQGNWRRSVACRGKFVAWVKGPAGECGLSGRNRCVGQGNWRRRVVCRGENVAWVKGNCRRVWSVGAKRASGSKELSAECGLSGRKGRMGQGASRRSVVCRGEIAVWVKGIVGGVWPVGAKTASEPKKPLLYASNVANHHSDQNCQNSQNMIHLL